jgi:glycine hydroxymethyltransferase
MTTHKTLRGPRGALILSRTAKSHDDTRTIAERIDRAIFPGLQGGPHMHSIAGITQTLFEAAQPNFKRYATRTVRNTKALATELQRRGFAVPTGGTDTHFFLLDVRPHGLTGHEAEALLEKNNILANRNSIFGDPSPFRPSGLRLGAPAVTTRGMGIREMKLIAECVDRVLTEKKDVRSIIATLCKQFPLPYNA